MGEGICMTAGKMEVFRTGPREPNPKPQMITEKLCSGTFDPVEIANALAGCADPAFSYEVEPGEYTGVTVTRSRLETAAEADARYAREVADFEEFKTLKRLLAKWGNPDEYATKPIISMGRLD